MLDPPLTITYLLLGQYVKLQSSYTPSYRVSIDQLLLNGAEVNERDNVSCQVSTQLVCAWQNVETHCNSLVNFCMFTLQLMG